MEKTTSIGLDLLLVYIPASCKTKCGSTSANTNPPLTPPPKEIGVVEKSNTPTVCTEWLSELFHALHSFTFVIQPKLSIHTQRLVRCN
jgi:hypothetical protein